VAQGVNVNGRIVSGKVTKGEDVRGIVLWLSPKDDLARKNSQPLQSQKATLIQKDKAFYPHLLVLPAGSTVSFPNKDPFFHNVFSLFNGKRFDLGLYEAGESRTARFDRAGVSYIFCNIHPEMNAIIVTLDTPYFSTTNDSGQFTISNVPSEIYELHIFADGLSKAMERSLIRDVQVKEENVPLGEIAIPERNKTLHHTNKYGLDYDAAPSSPYEH
jgi:plastocyanin